MRRVTLRLIPFVFVLYIVGFLDRTNVGLAALQMNRDLGFSARAFGLGAGMFFLGYALFEVPSNLVLVRVGARRWIARIVITWGVLASAMMFVRTPTQFHVMRFLLGVAEAGYFPAIMYYLSQWYPSVDARARPGAWFMIAIPLSSAIGGPIGGWLLGLNGAAGLAGWQWLFLVEGLAVDHSRAGRAAVFDGASEEAHWLSAEQRAWLVARLRAGSHDVGARAWAAGTARACASADLARRASRASRDDGGIRVFVLGSDDHARRAAHEQRRDRLADRRDRRVVRDRHARRRSELGSNRRTRAFTPPACATGGGAWIRWRGAPGDARVAHCEPGVGEVAVISFLAPFWVLPTMLLSGSVGGGGNRVGECDRQRRGIRRPERHRISANEDGR